MEHYHIRWGNGALDWEAFATEEEAAAAAKELLRPNETFTVEQLGAGCARCAGLK